MRYRLAIFDMDGTLTEELLDFAAIRGEMRVPEGVGILEYLAGLEGGERAAARGILDRHELAAADVCGVHEGAAEVLGHLRQRGVKTALLTRNSAECARRILGRHGLKLDHVGTREDIPHKPHPDSILNIVRKFGVSSGQTIMIGDYLYDLQAASAAGTDSALLCVKAELPAFAKMATYRIGRLMELAEIIEPGGARPDLRKSEGL